MPARVTDLSCLGRGQGAGRPTGGTQTRPLTARGTVAIAPASANVEMVVTVNSVSGRDRVEIPAGNWQPQNSALPAVGNTCLVIFDDLGDAWVPIWSTH